MKIMIPMIKVLIMAVVIVVTMKMVIVVAEMVLSNSFGVGGDDKEADTHRLISINLCSFQR